MCKSFLCRIHAVALRQYPLYLKFASSQDSGRDVGGAFAMKLRMRMGWLLWDGKRIGIGIGTDILSAN